ncbi:Cytochrome c551 peroxidase [hydrothermal vent metagenome]|uniref:Cytochrome c551 peroxidase n=1 Tax=hydrothermal vent metagenome TaxID=652676 RepID=A0A3B0XTE2_9ZZZZ
MHKYLHIRIAAIFILFFIFGRFPIADTSKKLKNEPILPIPFEIDLDAEKVSLGEDLFNDPGLSRNNRMSCAQCHQLARGGDDDLARSITNSGDADTINAPTVFNSVFNFRQTWRGAFKTLEAQAEGDLKNPRHSATNWKALIPYLNTNTGYVNRFTEIYPQGITRETVLNAIATYEKSLITPNSRFDQYLRGDDNILSYNELYGYRLFKYYGCIACHQGVNVGGNVFQKFGLFDNYFKYRGNITKADYGLMNVTGNKKDRFVFKVPALRNIEVTGPYLHDGSTQELKDVIKIMAKFQLGISIPDEHISNIEKFLHTLTGEYKGKSLAPSTK